MSSHTSRPKEEVWQLNGVNLPIQYIMIGNYVSEIWFGAVYNRITVNLLYVIVVA